MSKESSLKELPSSSFHEDKPSWKNFRSIKEYLATIYKKWDTLNQTEKWLYMFSMRKIPMLLYLTPKVPFLDGDHCQITIPYGYRSKNHLNSLYFGAFCVGADLCVGLLAMHHIRKAKKSHPEVILNFLFKDFHAMFTKRAEASTHFVCKDGAKIMECVNNAISHGKREEYEASVQAFVGDTLQMPVGEFRLTLSVKQKK